MAGKVALSPSTGSRSRFVTTARQKPARKCGKEPLEGPRRGRGWARRAPAAGCSGCLKGSGAPATAPAPRLARRQGWGAAPRPHPPAVGEPTARYCLPTPTARPLVCCRDQRQGGAGRGEPRRGLTVRVRGWGVQRLAPAPLPLSRRGGAQPHACRAKRRGGHRLRLKITPTRSAPCARRCRRGAAAAGSRTPRRSAPFVLPPSYGKDSHVTLRSGCTGVSRVSTAQRHDGHFASLPSGLGKGLPAWGRGVQGAWGGGGGGRRRRGATMPADSTRGDGDKLKPVKLPQ